MDEECCRLCGELIGDGGDGLCESCFFSNADPEWIQEHYPHLLDDADESDDDPQPRKRPRHAPRPKSARVNAAI